MLGEGRRFWILATSDSHAHYADAARPGSDFWPGEYQKTYVHAERSYAGVLDALRSGRIFARGGRSHHRAGRADANPAAGPPASARPSSPKRETGHAHGDVPRSRRQEPTWRQPARLARRRDHGRGARRVGGRKRRSQSDDDGCWHGSRRSSGPAPARRLRFPRRCLPAERDFYVRIRGTNTQDAEPPMDIAGENPWSDLWFYSNPIFVEFGN